MLSPSLIVSHFVLCFTAGTCLGFANREVEHFIYSGFLVQHLIPQIHKLILRRIHTNRTYSLFLIQRLEIILETTARTTHTSTAYSTVMLTESRFEFCFTNLTLWCFLMPMLGSWSSSFHHASLVILIGFDRVRLNAERARVSRSGVGRRAVRRRAACWRRAFQRPDARRHARADVLVAADLRVRPRGRQRAWQSCLSVAT